jgi:NO-binding membrane sensor protein with MHYT domain
LALDLLHKKARNYRVMLCHSTCFLICNLRQTLVVTRVVNNQAKPSFGLWLGLGLGTYLIVGVMGGLSLQAGVFWDEAWIELGSLIDLCTLDRPPKQIYIGF